MFKVFFLPTANAGVVWHRMLMYFRYMSKLPDVSMIMDKFYPESFGIYPWQHPENHNSAFLLKLQDIAAQAHLIVIQYVITDYALAVVQGLKKLFSNIVFFAEIDDYCFELNPSHPVAPFYQPGRESPTVIQEHLTMSDGVIVSTPYLKKLYSELNDNIFVMPNGIDFQVWDNLKESNHPNNRIRIGWSGAASHNEDIRFVEKTIWRILEKYKNVEFFFQGGAPQFLVKKHPRVKCSQKWATPYVYPQRMKDLKFDIGIAPLLDNNFNRAKSNLRWLEYSALKIPTVASCVEHFKTTIKDGKTGFLCYEPEEFFDRLCLLIENEGKRKEIGNNAYQEIRKNFNMEKLSKVYLDTLRGFYNDFNANKDKVSVTRSRGK